MTLEHYQASENMRIFFERLLAIKEFVKQKYVETEDEILKEIYDKMDATIKQSQDKDASS